MNISVKRVYESPASQDGMRILVDRLWPRGLSKDDARLDLWCKKIAPSQELRQWFQHDEQKWSEFKQRYFAELDENTAAVNELLSQLQGGQVSLLYASKASRYNNAVALKEYLTKKLK